MKMIRMILAMIITVVTIATCKACNMESEIDVPNVVGKPVEEARQELANAGFLTVEAEAKAGSVVAVENLWDGTAQSVKADKQEVDISEKVVLTVVERARKQLADAARAQEEKKQADAERKAVEDAANNTVDGLDPLPAESACTMRWTTVLKDRHPNSKVKRPKQLFSTGKIDDHVTKTYLGMTVDGTR